MKKQPFRRFERSIPLETKAARAGSGGWAGVQPTIGAGPLVLQHYAQFTGRRL